MEGDAFVEGDTFVEGYTFIYGKFLFKLGNFTLSDSSFKLQQSVRDTILLIVLL